MLSGVKVRGLKQKKTMIKANAGVARGPVHCRLY